MRRLLALFLVTVSFGLGFLAPDLAAEPSARELVSQGNSRLASGNPADAVALFEKALVSEPESPEILYNLGVAHYAAEDYDEAITQFQSAAIKTKSIELEAQALYNLGNCSFRKGQNLLDADLKKAVGHLQEAVGRYRSCLDLVENDPEAEHNITVVKLLLKDLQDRLKKKEEEQKEKQENEEKSIPERIREVMVEQHANLMRTRTATRGGEVVEVLEEVVRRTREDQQTLTGASSLGPEELDGALQSLQFRHQQMLTMLGGLEQAAGGLSEESAKRLQEIVTEFFQTTLQAQNEAESVLTSSETQNLSSEESAEFSSAMARLGEGIEALEQALPETRELLRKDVEAIRPELQPKEADLVERTAAITQEMVQAIQGMQGALAQQQSGAPPATPPGAPPGATPPQVDPEVLEAFEGALPHVENALAYEQEADQRLSEDQLVESEDPQANAVEELRKALEKFPKDENQQENDQQDQQQQEQQQDEQQQQQDQNQDQNQDQQNQDQDQQQQQEPEARQRPPEQNQAKNIIDEERNRRRNQQDEKRGQYRRVDKDW